MSIAEALELLERDYVEKDIKMLTPKDRLWFWQNLKEFVTPKIQRAEVRRDEEPIDEIVINYPGERED